MASPVGPLLANVFMSKFDHELSLFSLFHYKYADDILRTILKVGENILMYFVNTMHPNLKFTRETEDETCGLSFLDMRVNHVGNKIETPWYIKKTDTGVVLNYNCESPTIHKSDIVSDFVHRIFNTCSTWSNFHEGLKKAQTIVRDNQYPRSFLEKITGSTLDNIIDGKEIVKTAKHDNSQKTINTRLMLSYHGPSSVGFAKNLKKTPATLGSLNAYLLPANSNRTLVD